MVHLLSPANRRRELILALIAVVVLIGTGLAVRYRQHLLKGDEAAYRQATATAYRLSRDKQYEPATSVLSGYLGQAKTKERRYNTMIQLAAQHEHLQNDQEATEWYRRAEQTAGRDQGAEAYRGLARHAVKRNDKATAIAYYRRLVAFYRARPQLLEGVTGESIKLYEDSIKVLEASQ
ncbi:MAG TPA: hypothetical protein VK963_04190 [Candidatus Saccharimonadales bacterium]|nr:hypothetical protein [Candidatus Saccharimonadales bacterium]